MDGHGGIVGGGGAGGSFGFVEAVVVPGWVDVYNVVFQNERLLMVDELFFDISS